MNENELAHCYALLGVPLGAERDALAKALMQKILRSSAPMRPSRIASNFARRLDRFPAWLIER